MIEIQAPAVRAYLVALGVGVLAGLLYGLLKVKSPAPPIIALIGLFGMLLGEQAVPLARRLMAGSTHAVETPEKPTTKADHAP